jgi:hypothetical protein
MSRSRSRSPRSRLSHAPTEEERRDYLAKLNQFGWNPFHYACHKGRAAEVAKMLSDGCTVNAVALRVLTIHGGT